MLRVAIIGGLGYIGMQLTQHLKAQAEVVVFGRKNLTILADEEDNVHIRSIEEIESSGPFDAVINLAYPTSYSRQRNFETNLRIIEAIRTLARADAAIIHTSSVSVFGYGLDEPIVRMAIAFRRDFHTIEAKIHIENELLKAFPSSALHIIRLGNVWGPGSAFWLHNPADRIIYNHPFPKQSLTAPSNITDVGNIGSLVETIIQKGRGRQQPVIHHLAEFSGYTWGYFFDRLGELLNENPLYRPFKIQYPLTYGQELGKIASSLYPRQVFESMLQSRRLSSLAKSLVDILPANIRQIGKSFPMPEYRSKLTADIVFSTQKEFKTEVELDWQPPIDIEESFRRAASWLRESGYILKPDH